MSHTVDPRIAVLSSMSSPTVDPDMVGMSWDDAVKELDAYRAAVLRHVLALLEASAGDAAAEKLLDDNPELAEWLQGSEAESDG